MLYSGEGVAAVPAVLGLGLLAVLNRSASAAEQRRAVLLVAPAAVLALLLVAAPDVLEDLVFARL